MTVITISGIPGTGTTTIANLLTTKMHIPYIYTGDIFRTLAKQYKMSLEEFSTYAENHPEVDNELDEQQLEILIKGEIILEGRLAGWIAHHNNIPATKIMLLANLKVRAQRIVKREGGDIKKRSDEIRIREQSENRRYKNYYNIDVSDLSIYDIVIDTSELSPEMILQKILDSMKK